MFRSNCETIQRNLQNKVRPETKIKFYKVILVPALLYSGAVMGSAKDSCKWMKFTTAAEMKFQKWLKV